MHMISMNFILTWIKAFLENKKYSNTRYMFFDVHALQVFVLIGPSATKTWGGGGSIDPFPHEKIHQSTPSPTKYTLQKPN